MKKLILLCLTALFLTTTLFAKDTSVPKPVKFKDGLKFYNRFLTDDELDKLPFPKITIPFYDKLFHSSPKANGMMRIVFSPDFPYQSRYLILENDKSGNQVFHFFMDPDERSKVSKLTNIIEHRDAYQIRDKSSFEFDFYAKPVDFTEFDFTHMNVKMGEKYKTFFKGLISNSKVYFQFNDYDDSYPLEDAKTKRIMRYEMGELNPDDYNHVKVTVDNYAIKAEFNGKTAEATYSEKIPKKQNLRYTVGYDWVEKALDFSEIFVKNIKISEKEY